MLKDRYDLALTTASAAARDAYVQASGLALTFYPVPSRLMIEPSPPILVLPWPTPARRRSC